MLSLSLFRFPFTIPYRRTQMADVARVSGRSRRDFMKDIAAYGAGTIVAARLGDSVGEAQTASWKSKIGLELYTVRDLLMTDYEGALAKVAEIGYTEVEPTGYNNMSPKEFRAMLDRLKLTMPSTPGPSLLPASATAWERPRPPVGRARSASSCTPCAIC
jgi:hypothetical protein